MFTAWLIFSDIISGMRPRQIQTLVGVVYWKRRVGRCPQDCQGTQVAPLDAALGISAYQQTSLELMQMGCALSSVCSLRDSCDAPATVNWGTTESKHDLELGAVGW